METCKGFWNMCGCEDCRKIDRDLETAIEIGGLSSTPLASNGVMHEFRDGYIRAKAHPGECVIIEANDAETGDDAEVCMDLDEARAFHTWLGRVLGAHETKARPVGDGWEDNAKYLLERCPFTVRVREGGGPEDLLSSLVVTFQGMERRLSNAGTSATADATRERQRERLRDLIPETSRE